MLKDNPPSDDEEVYEDYYKPIILNLIRGMEIDNDYRRDAEGLIRELSFAHPDREGEIYILSRMYQDMR